MDFSTQIKMDKPMFSFSYEDTVLMLGSCFAENIGSKLADIYFPIDVNPFGTLYNPASIAKAMRMLINEVQLNGEDLFVHEDTYHSFTHHSRFSGDTVDKSLYNINSRLSLSSSKLKTADKLIITFGTSWVYRLKSSGEVVANCHKLPDKMFIRERMSVSEIVEDWKSLLSQLWEENSSLKVLFTVSPVRHWKDGANGNQLSKATLLLAIEELRTLFPEQTDYFPAYELLMDELRDYRFYADDMLHPSDLAVNYIWEKFASTYLSKDAQCFTKDLSAIEKAINHRPFNNENKPYQDFLRQTIRKAQEINKAINSVELSNAVDELKKRLIE